MKLTYINEKNMSISLAYSAPYFLQSIEGEDGLSNQIISSNKLNEDGTIVSGMRLPSRDINIVGIIKGNNSEDILIKRKKLIEVFNPKLKGKLIYENRNIIKAIECYIEDSPTFSNRNVNTQQSFIINLYAPNPFWSDISESKTEIALWKGGFYFPLSIPKNKGTVMGVREPSLIVNVKNTGDVKTGVLI